VGKETGETAHIERWNNTLRQQLARFLRKTLSFSKCIKMHEIYLKLFIHRYNTELKEEKNVLVYTIGCLIIVRVFAANVFDWKAVRQLIMDLFSFLHTITKIWADSAYSGPELSDLALASNSDA